MTAGAAGFRARLRAGDDLSGIVVRTPSHQVIEVLAAAMRPDVVMLDTEHAAWNAEALDATIAVAVALDLPVLVRVAELTAASLQRPLDMGATGVVVPHVRTAEEAARAVLLAHYGDGGRGYSGSTRSAGWGTRGMNEVLREAAERTTVVVQVEDPVALTAVDAIAATSGVDAVFVGAADLTVALGAGSPTDERVDAAVARVLDACAAASTTVVAFAADAAAAADWRQRGVRCVLLGTDQARLR